VVKLNLKKTLIWKKISFFG